MLLKKLSVTNSRGSTLDLPLEDISEGFIVKEITGLGPVKATLVSSSFANVDGEEYHSSRRESRNIIIRLGLAPDYGSTSVYELRDRLYSFLMTKTEALLKFNLFDKFATNVITQNLDLEIKARVESLEPNVFSKDPTVDLTLLCFNPDFIDPEPVIFEGMTVNDLEEDTLSYDGSVETGVLFTLTPDRPMEEFTIYHRTPNNRLHTAYFTYDIGFGDRVEISSVRGVKYVSLFRNNIEHPVLYALSPQSSWLELAPGDNVFRVYAEGDPVPFKIEYNNKYGGL